MTAFGIEPLRPAYGRVYTNQKAVLKDWQDGKDFRCISGQMCSIRDFGPEESLEVRYGKRLEKAMIVYGK